MKALEEFLKDPTADYYISCSSKNDRDSKRSSLFHARRKLPELLRDAIGIKSKDVDGRMFVVIYSRVVEEHYRMVNGKLVPVVNKPVSVLSADNERLKTLMERDGYSPEEIEEALTNASDS